MGFLSRPSINLLCLNHSLNHPSHLNRQPQPAVPQQLNRQPQPSVPQQLNRLQPQPEIRKPQPIPFQTRPKTPRQLVPQRQTSQPQPAQQQASSDFFKDTLFSQPI